LSAPTLARVDGDIHLSGEWTLVAFMDGARLDAVRAGLKEGGIHARWDLSGVERMDSAAAVLLWQTWGYRWPGALTVSPAIRASLERVAILEEPLPPPAHPGIPSRLLGGVARIGAVWLVILRHLLGLVELHGRLLLDLGFLLRHPRETPWKELSANIYKAGFQALPVLALMGFLIGITISYLSALQLKMYGADIFIVNVLGISIIRELGPVLVAILVAGRSGSAMTAQIGVMRVTEEIDALATLGISRTIRVVLPKVLALTFVMPLLVIWSSATALLGGALAAWSQLDLSPIYFFESLPRVVPITNLWIGLAKGMVFGFLIALLACRFGLHVRPNTESLSAHTTASVVSAITLVIIMDALFAVLTRNIGMPGL
jgi:phospholipid/cholesterol/gamma-HCH transport system permease protein